MVAIGRTETAALYRAINSAYRPFAEGDLAKWATLEAATVEGWTQQAEVAMAVERSWRRESGFAGCLYGARGEAPWAFVACVGCHGAYDPPDAPQNVTERPQQAEQGRLG